MNIAFTIIENFNEFSENTRELLYRFSEKKSTAWQKYHQYYQHILMNYLKK